MKKESFKFFKLIHNLVTSTMAKKTIDPGTQGRTNKVLKRPTDLTGINKVPIMAKCLVGKSPPTHASSHNYFATIYYLLSANYELISNASSVN